MNTFEAWFARRYPGLAMNGVKAVLELTAEGATIPFIARYRKERTGNMDEVGIGQCVEAAQLWESLEKRKSFVVKEIEDQGKLTPELKSKIMTADDILVIEDLYLPFKKKRKTKAQKAKESGLLPLAEWVWGLATGEITDNQLLEDKAAAYVDAKKEVPDVATAIAGTQSILVERVSEDAGLRAHLRNTLFEEGHVNSEKTDEAPADSKYTMYFSFSETISSLKKPFNSHRYLAVRRGASEGELKMSIGGEGNDEEFVQRLINYCSSSLGIKSDTPGSELMQKAVRLAVKVYMLPSLEKEVHTMLKDLADVAAIEVFAENVKTVLLESPFGSRTVLGIDPGLRTGCKLALVDRSGKFIADTVIYLHTAEGKENARHVIQKLLGTVNLEGVAVGNGTAGRETHAFIKQLFQELGKSSIPVVLISESGASIYSASEIARKEFPDLDLTVRGAISIARRLQDPLAELVKVDPKSIGVGQYQHDVSQPQLKKALQRVVESCVNSVGVDVNTASEYLLSFVSGIGARLAKSLVTHRESKGVFSCRQELLSVSGFGSRAFEQAAGFLRIPDGKNPLDNTGVHPERYEALERSAKRLSASLQECIGPKATLLNQDKALREEVGDYTFEDMLLELSRPGRDPRQAFEQFEFKEGLHSINDVQEEMICPGIITNVTNFGAFVDIGVKQDGFVHISKLSDQFVDDPSKVVSPGQKVRVKVLEIDRERNRISLTLKLGETAAKPRRDGPSDRTDARGDRQRGRGRKPGAPVKLPKEEKLSQTPFAGLGSLLTK